MRIGYICDYCNITQTIKWFIFKCLYCDREICEDCMYGYATCKQCAAGKSDAVLKLKFDECF